MSRPGKIERLPSKIREEIEYQLDEGKMATEIIEWLNQLPEVQAFLKKEFNAEPISESHFSNWRDGVLVEQRHRNAARTEYSDFVDQHDMAKWLGEDDLQKNVSLLMTARIAKDCAALEWIADAEERAGRRTDLIQDFYRLRRSDGAASKGRLDDQKREDLAQATEQRVKEAESHRPLTYEEQRARIRQILGTGDPQ